MTLTIIRKAMVSGDSQDHALELTFVSVGQEVLFLRHWLFLLLMTVGCHRGFGALQ